MGRRLKTYKTSGRTYADVLDYLMDTVPPREFLDGAIRELEREAASYPNARGKLGLN